MPWLHLDWSKDGALHKIVVTDDDAEPIAECHTVEIVREYDGSGDRVTMHFIVPDLEKFNEAASSKNPPKPKKKVNPKSGEVKEIPHRRGEEHLEPWERTDWVFTKFQYSEWKTDYDATIAEFTRMKVSELDDEIEWCNLEVISGEAKIGKVQRLAEHLTDLEFERRHLKKGKKKAKLAKS